MRNPEYEITEHLLKHGDVYREDILETFVKPSFIGRLFEDEMIEEFVDMLQQEIAIDLRLTYPEVNGIINRKYLEDLLGRQYLDFNK